MRVGDRVTTTTQLTTVDQPGSLEVYVYVPIEHSGQLKMNLPVQVLDSEGKVLADTKVSFISPQVDNTTQTVLVKARIANGNDALRQSQYRFAVFLVIRLCIAAALAWYLQSPSVKKAFGGLSPWPTTVKMLVLTIFTVLLSFPFYWMVIATFKQNIDLYGMENNPFIFNLPPTLDNLRLLFGQTRFLTWLANTAIVGAIVVAITLLLSVPAAYALARLTGKWGERLGIAIFLTYLVPPTLLFIPLSRVVASLGLQDTIWSLVLVYPSITVPFSIWLLMGFFKSIPKELEDAAMVDGLTRFGAFVKMVIPISLSGILTVVIFTFTLVTQEYVYALTFISPESQQMVGVGIPIFLVRGDVYFWGSLMAACLIASLPIAFVYNLFLDRFIAGFTVGAVKG